MIKINFHMTNNTICLLFSTLLDKNLMTLGFSLIGNNLTTVVHLQKQHSSNKLSIVMSNKPNKQ